MNREREEAPASLLCLGEQEGHRVAALAHAQVRRVLEPLPRHAQEGARARTAAAAENSRNFAPPLTPARCAPPQLRVQKENLLKEIKFQMELFNLHIQQGRDLCYKLSNPGLASTIKTAPAQLQAQLAIEVVSPILANANNPLTVVR